ncbi:M28 family peptidase [Blastococcus sp. MG754426]|uniref:M28 family peptidase n=1 Tax=unclassified Blastococcus TaxID=2619396 RepID=UPI001EEFB5C4|nr:MULTISPECIES: M28 family peptidase [unclassified Blastococcus]MCF6509397.1 M28 family peptidase [Blastococcus sp. MG754426]MCF6512785.1 M28 family peptidase [Blastococcus sp. MG754427]
MIALALPVTTATAAPRDPCDRRHNNTYAKLLECVDLEDVLEHQRAFQKIADSSDDPVYPGTRAAGTDGYADSVEYVAGLLRDARMDVTLDPVEVTFNFPAVLRQLSPVEAEYETGVFTGSGAGRLEQGTVVPVDLVIDGDRATSSSGCEAADFEGVDLGGPVDIALLQRGTCNFGDKVVNAENAGAEAVVIFNQGSAPDRMELIVANAATLGDGSTIQHGIPVVGASFDQGVALAAAGATAFVEVLPAETRTDYNVIAEVRGRDRNNVVMAGAHLDSVIEGPGINDNGSGSAALLETALSMASLKPHNTLRFAWWAAEEQGLVGSNSYVAKQPQSELDRIALYMNYDMVASPNHVQMVYDSDESTWDATAPIPAGSTAIEEVYESYYTKIGVPYDDAEYSGRSDYQAFINAGIPSGGLFTGAEVVKTDQQAEIWGGVAGDQFDPCYHEACDTIDNLALDALDVNSDLIAFAMLTFAFSTESVNGVKGRPIPGPAVELPAPAGAEGTFEEAAGGGGLEHDHVHGHEILS